MEVFRGAESQRSDDAVLGELNADFRRSKVELIHRFLSDQEELNKRFAEYDLNDEDEEDGGETVNNQKTTSRENDSELQRKQQIVSKVSHRLTEEDILLDLECRSELDDDNLSTTSAIQSSAGGSDIGVLDDDPLTPNTELYRSQFDMACQNVFKGEVRHAQLVNVPQPRNKQFPMCTRNKTRATSRGLTQQPKTAPPTSKRDSRRHKVLVKKNVRPQTATGIRTLLNPAGESFQKSWEEETQDYAAKFVPSQQNDNYHTVSYSCKIDENNPTKATVRLRKTSWLGNHDSPENYGPPANNETHSGNEIGKVKYSAAAMRSQHSVLKDDLYARSCDPRTILVGNSIRIYKSPGCLLQQGTAYKSKELKKDLAASSEVNRSLLSIDISPTKPKDATALLPITSSGGQGSGYPDVRSSLCSASSSRSMYSASGTNQRMLVGPMSDICNRQITVVKLPPLDGAVGVEKSEQSNPFVNTAAKDALAQKTEFMAG